MDDKTAEIIENMIRWAESRLEETGYVGWCLSFIEDALEIANGIEVFGGDSARESAELYSDAMRRDIPERGAFVFYDCICLSEEGPVNWGHCGIGLGDGRVIHAWDKVRIDDYRDIACSKQLSSPLQTPTDFLGLNPILTLPVPSSSPVPCRHPLIS